MNALPRKAARITTVRLTQHASIYEDPINVLAEKAGLTCRKIQHIPEECAHKLHWDVLAAIIKVIASPILSVKTYANASLGTAANDVKLISKVKKLFYIKHNVSTIKSEPMNITCGKLKLLNNNISICLQFY